jgi:SAM-dependent methyltransferase
VHESAFEKVRAFRNAYFAGRRDERLRVLDVGSGCSEGSLSCRDLFVPPVFDYVGLDIYQGHNVDYVPEDPYSWSELGSESFDVVVSNQVFEHIPFFWITAAEVARVLVPGGLVVVVSPSSGFPHRYPIDCWRFYPDSWNALCDYVGLELLESYREWPVTWRRVIPGIYWRDAMMVARRPALGSAAEGEEFTRRLGAIAATRPKTPGAVVAPVGADLVGAATQAYERTHTLRPDEMLVHPLQVVRQLVWPRVRRAWASSPGGELRRRLRARQGRESLERGARSLPWP